MSAPALASMRPAAAGTEGEGLDLSRLFRPRSIAVLGATETAGAVGSQVVEILLQKGFGGTILPINPKYRVVHGLPCHPDIGALPEAPDVLVVAVPAAHAPAAIAAAGRRGIAFALVLASGFAEAGEAGAVLQDALQETARAWGVRVIGPNCQGFMNVAEGIHVGFGPPYRLDYGKGAVSVVSQSGAFGNAILMGLSAEGVGIRHYVSTGNEVDLSALDFVGGMAADPETRVVAAYVEGFQDARTLPRLAASAHARGVPLVVWKVGASEAGARAAASHTASLAGDRRLYASAFAQLGVVAAFDVGDMADCIRALSTGRRAAGNRVGIVTISGGAGVAMADRAEELGLAVEPLAAETRERLQGVLPAFAATANPVDVTAGALERPDKVAAALEAIVEDAAVDMLAVSLAAASGPPAMRLVEALSRLVAENALPVAVAWNVPPGNEAACAALDAAGVPLFATPGRAVRGLAAIHAVSAVLPPPSAHLPRGMPAAPARQLDESASRQHLADTGVRNPREAVVATEVEAIAAAGRIGHPVVMKLLSASIAHKSDVGGVRVGLSGDAAVAAAYRDLADLADLAGRTGADGILVQEQVGGIETILGARIDPTFGPVVVFGAGGVLTEVVSDAALRLAPIDVDEARRMIAGTRIARVLDGIRGTPPADIDALAEAIAALSRAIADPASALLEIEINPLFVGPVGAGVIAGDCLARIIPEAG